MAYVSRFAALGLLTAAANVVATAAPAAVVTFANYVQSSAGAGIRFVSTGNTAATAGGHLYTTATPRANTVGARAVNFSFLQPDLQAAFGTVSADFTLDFIALGNAPASLSNGVLAQPGLIGNFSFVYTGTTPLVIGNATYQTGANLLSGTVGGSYLTGQPGGSSGNFNASTAGGNAILFTSDVMNFAPASSYDLALTLTQIIPSLGQIDASHSLNGFRAVTTGSFSADQRFTIRGLGGPVPEPATWGMMVIGFALLGHQLRRRKTDHRGALSAGN